MHPSILLVHRIFQTTKIFVVIFEKILKQSERVFPRSGQQKIYILALIPLLCHIDIDSIFWFPIPSGCMMCIVGSVFMIIVPLASYGFTIFCHKDISTLSHVPIKGLHHGGLLKGFPKFGGTHEKLSIGK